jgi:Ca2+-binding EF-hand superfamily protein
MNRVAKKRLALHAENHKNRNEAQFLEYDEDKSKYLDQDEFNKLVNEHPPHFEYTFAIADVDGNKRVEKEELLETMHPAPMYISGDGIVSEMASVTVTDADGNEIPYDGPMTDGIPDELDLHDDFVTEEAKLLIEEADTDKDGSLNSEEMMGKSELFVGSLSGYVHTDL